MLLWFTVIKGPDIRLIHTIELSVAEAPDSNLPFEMIALKPIPLLFVNNGSKSGVLYNIRTELKPTAEFGKFYKSVQQQVLVKSTTAKYRELPLTIPERATAVLTLNLSIRVKPWKDISRLDELPTIPLGVALQTIWYEGVGRLKEFSNFTGEIGTLNITIRRTKRRNFRMRLLDDTVVSEFRIGRLPESFLAMAQHHSNNFSDLRDTDAELVRKIRYTAQPFLSDCNANIPWLSKKFKDAGVTRLSMSGADSIFEWGRSDDPAIHVLRHEKRIMDMVTNYGQQVKQYNEKIQAMAPATPWDVPSPEVEAIEALMSELGNKSSSFQDELVKFRDMLRAETEHLVEVPPTKDGSTP